MGNDKNKHLNQDKQSQEETSREGARDSEEFYSEVTRDDKSQRDSSQEEEQQGQMDQNQE